MTVNKGVCIAYHINDGNYWWSVQINWIE